VAWLSGIRPSVSYPLAMVSGTLNGFSYENTILACDLFYRRHRLAAAVVRAVLRLDREEAPASQTEPAPTARKLAGSRFENGGPLDDAMRLGIDFDELLLVGLRFTQRSSDMAKASESTTAAAAE
jgi:hypothetical protein